MEQFKILLFGKNGQLGWELNNLLTVNYFQVHAFSHKELDVRDFRKIKDTINKVKPNLIINASAYTNVDQAETDIDTAMQVNGYAPAIMAENAKKMHIPFIHYSTDYVFDGKKEKPYTEKDIVNPLNIYGKSKLKGEQAISQIGGGFLIIRTSWVYSTRGNNFVTKVLRWSQQQKTLQIVTDQIGSPTWARSLAQVTADLLKKSTNDINNFFFYNQGIYHLGGLGSVSRYEFVKEILRIKPSKQWDFKIRPALTIDFFSPALRPFYTALDCAKFEQTFDLKLPNWDESLKFALTDY